MASWLLAEMIDQLRGSCAISELIDPSLHGHSEQIGHGWRYWREAFPGLTLHDVDIDCARFEERCRGACG